MSKLQVTAIWNGSAFVPDHVFAEDCKTIARGSQVTLTIEQNRHPEFHAWFFGMLGAVCRAGYWEGDTESLLRYIKLGIGYGDWFPHSNGTATFIPKSISFARCDQTRFRRFVFFTEKFLAERLGVDTETIFAEADRETGHAVDRRAA